MGKMLKIAVFLCAMIVLSSGLFRNRRPRCGIRIYNPRTHLCCAGHVADKYGISPSCCGRRVYDNKFQICCAGRVSSRSGIRPACCKKRVYDAAFYKCINGRVVRK